MSIGQNAEYQIGTRIKGYKVAGRDGTQIFCEMLQYSDIMFKTVCQATSYVWGSGRHGELGTFMSVGRHCATPRHLPAFDNMQSIELGLNCSFLCNSSGSVYSIGEGSYGRLGHGNSDDLNHPALISALQVTRDLLIFFFAK